VSDLELIQMSSANTHCVAQQLLDRYLSNSEGHVGI
jgi:hypothetical protein